MQAVCCSCQFINRPQALKTTRQLQTHQSYYLICEEGHIQCRECASRHDHDDKYCHLGENPHPKWPNKIECLLHNKDSILLDRLKEHFRDLQNKRKQKQAELQNCQRHFQVQKRRFFYGDRDMQQLAQNNINIQILEDAPINSIGAIMDKLQKDISLIQQKIRQQERKYGCFKFMFDSLASAVVLTTTILQAITIASFFNQYQDVLVFLVIYFVILGLYYFNFLIVIVWQIYKKNEQSFLQKFLYFLLAFTFLPFVVALFLPTNTLQITNKKSYDRCYFIPKKFLFDWKCNYCVLFLKIIGYWSMLIRYSTMYQEAYQQAAFILSFFQVISLVYLNLRYNNDKQPLENIRKQYLS